MLGTPRDKGRGNILCVSFTACEMEIKIVPRDILLEGRGPPCAISEGR